MYVIQTQIAKVEGENTDHYATKALITLIYIELLFII